MTTNFEQVGKCKCGQTAFAKMSIGLSPGKWTEPEPICDACIQADRKQMLDAAIALIESPEKNDALCPAPQVREA